MISKDGKFREIIIRLVTPIIAAACLYLVAFLILDKQKENEEAVLDYLSSENMKLEIELGEILDIPELRKQIIDTAMFLSDQVETRNRTLSFLDVILAKLPKQVVLEKLSIKNNRAKLILVANEEALYLSYCQILRESKLDCNLKEKRVDNQSNISFHLSISRPF